MFRVARKQSFSEYTFLLEIEVPPVAAAAQPGHHVDIHINPDAPPVTLPLADFDRERGTITIVERARDLPTERLMMLGEGDEVFQVRGPLGSPCRVDALGKVVLAAEDLGVASVYPRARAYHDAGSYTVCVLGFPTRDDVFWQDRFSGIADEIYIATQDGSYGVTGKIGATLRALCETQRDIERVIVIAGLQSMRRVARIASDSGIDARVAFDAVRSPLGVESIFDSPDGSQEVFSFARAPELPAAQVDFEKLLARQKTIEKAAQTPS